MNYKARSHPRTLHEKWLIKNLIKYRPHDQVQLSMIDQFQLQTNSIIDFNLLFWFLSKTCEKEAVCHSYYASIWQLGWASSSIHWQKKKHSWKWKGWWLSTNVLNNKTIQGELKIFTSLNTYIMEAKIK